MSFFCEECGSVLERKVCINPDCGESQRNRTEQEISVIKEPYYNHLQSIENLNKLEDGKNAEIRRKRRTVLDDEEIESEFINKGGDSHAIRILDKRRIFKILRNDIDKESLDKTNFLLNWDANQLSLERNREYLITVEQNVWSELDFYRHQVATAHFTLFEAGCKALLADEVGLGKTIEAGLVICEKYLRKEANNVLILAPPSLLTQWRDELLDHFNLEFNIAAKVDPVYKKNPSVNDYPFLIMSIERAKIPKYREKLSQRYWDLIVVDEAHYLRNKKTQRYEELKQIQTRWILLLTATPIQNTLSDLYSLAHFIRPGTFGGESAFKEKYFADNKGQIIKNPDSIQDVLRSFMVRNKRNEISDFRLPPRKVFFYQEPPGKSFKELHDLLWEYTREEYSGSFVLPLYNLQRLVTSSPLALSVSLKKRKTKVGSSPKLDKLISITELVEFKKYKLLKELVLNTEEKFIIFTDFRGTQSSITRILEEESIPIELYHGGLNIQERNKAIKSFKEKSRILISTSAGGVGLNLQFCWNMINFDLPWNPMIIEQRIGRIHRVGQKETVNIYNLTLKETIEDTILSTLYRKIKLFEEAIGDLDAILFQSGERGISIQNNIFSAVAHSPNITELEKNIELIANKLKTGQQIKNDVNKLDNSIFSKLNLAAEWDSIQTLYE